MKPLLVSVLISSGTAKICARKLTERSSRALMPTMIRICSLYRDLWFLPTFFLYFEAIELTETI